MHPYRLDIMTMAPNYCNQLGKNIFRPSSGASVFLPRLCCADKVTSVICVVCVLFAERHQIGSYPLQ